MKKYLIKIAVLFTVFVLSVVIISNIINQGNTDMTAEMANATYPVITTVVGEHEANTLYGYSNEMQAQFMRDTITPLKEDRKLTIQVKETELDINEISYEVRSLDTTRLVEDNKVSSFTTENGKIQAEIPIKDLIDKGTEYILTIVLHCEGNQEIRYYTRIILPENNYAGELMNFSNELQKKIYNRDKSSSEDIVKYLESNSSGDNSTYNYVNIHSSYDQVTWGELNVKVESDTIPQIKELSDTIGTINYNYIVSIEEENGHKDYLNVDEYYYIRYTSNRMYLLDYERFASEIFTPVSERFEENAVNLGIVNEDVEYQENMDGTIVSFVQENTLWQYNNNTDRIIKVFGFYNNNVSDVRDNYDQHKVKIVSMDENGNMQFMVCGYMNRGRHEGETGIAMYYYDSTINCIEEEVFLPSTKPYQLIKEDIDNLIYVNRNNEMYIYLEESLYKIDLSIHTYEIVVSGLTEGTYTVSEDNSMVAWQEELERYNSQTIHVLSLQEGSQYQVIAEDEECIAPLGFMQQDFIYGIAVKDDIKYDVTGVMRFPMYAICIRNETEEEITYKKDGIYIMGATLKNNVIQLQRFEKRPDGSYTEVDSDSIMNNDFVENTNVSLTKKVTEEKETELQLELAYNISESQPKLLTPREVVYEESRNVEIDENKTNTDDNYYYVYARYGMMGVYTDAAEAIETAGNYSGVVLNQSQNYIWEKNKRQTSTKINQVSLSTSDGENSLGLCLTQMLTAAGYTVDAKPLLEQGEPPLSILNKYVEGDVLDLTGLSVDNVLYYVSRGYPVLAVLGENKGVLIVGYDAFNVLILDPSEGTEPYKKGLNDSREYFNDLGNNFISFVN